MVKGYDPSRTDPSKILLQYLFRWSTTPNPISLQQGQLYVKDWLKNSKSTSSIYKSFSFDDNSKSQPQKTIKGKSEQKRFEIRPQIVLKKKCSSLFNWSILQFLKYKSNSQYDQNYPAFTEDNKIIICLNFITNKTELKENLDRQLTILSLRNKQYSTNDNKISQQKNSSNKENSSNKQIQSNEQNSSNRQNKQLQQIQQTDKRLVHHIYEGCKQGYKNYLLDKQIEQRMSKKCAKYLFFRRSQRLLPPDAKFRYAAKIVSQVL